MLKTEAMGMQGLSREVTRYAIAYISQQRMAQMTQMNSKLMCPAGLGF